MSLSRERILELREDQDASPIEYAALCDMALSSLDGVVPQEQLENIRRAVERGMSFAQKTNNSPFVDCFQHILNNYHELLAAATPPEDK